MDTTTKYIVGLNEATHNGFSLKEQITSLWKLIRNTVAVISDYVKSALIACSVLSPEAALNQIANAFIFGYFNLYIPSIIFP